MCCREYSQAEAKLPASAAISYNEARTFLIRVADFILPTSSSVMSAPAIFDACTLFGPWPRQASELTPETLLQGMAQNNITRSLVTATTGIFYDYRQGNTETLALAKSNAAHFFPVATLDPRAYPECMEEAEIRAGRA